MKDHQETGGSRQQARPASEPLRVVHPDAAGIDIGSQKHYVAVPANRDPEPVRCFGCLTPDLQSLARWLVACGIKTVALEATGVYWIPPMQVLEELGLEVYLVDARQAKGLPGRKTDVKDCQWLQQLHKVLSDITGVTGRRILQAILAGERDPVVLAPMKHPLVQSSQDTLAQALTGDWRAEHLFTLRQAMDLYEVYQQKIEACDQEIEKSMQSLDARAEAKDLEPRKGGTRRKNQVHFDLRGQLYELTGTDLTSIDGIDAMTAQTVVSESGIDMSRFATEKHYSSWLGLCPNHQITGGKVRRRCTRRVRNRAAQALRVAAQSLHRSKTALGAYFRRMRSRLGPAKAITATAHKLAILIYRMLKYGMNYVDVGQEAYEQQYRERTLQMLKRRVKQMGYALVDLHSGEVVS